MHPADDREPAGLALAGLLATRLCHDLAGPVGTLAGALELAAEDADAAGEAIAIARDGAQALAARLGLHRAAWGGLGEAVEAPPLDAKALRALAAGLPGGHRLRLDLHGLDAGIVPPATGQVVLNALMLAAEALPGGGAVTLAREPSGAVVVSIAGPRANWPAGLADLLASPRETLVQAARSAGPRSLQAPLLALVAAARGVGLTLEPADHAGGLAALRATPPAG